MRGAPDFGETSTRVTSTGYSAVSLGSPLTGSLSVEPALVIRKVVRQELVGLVEYACLGWIDSAELQRVVFAPVRHATGATYLPVRSRDGYQPEPPADDTERLARALCAGAPFVPPAVVLSGRRRWIWSPTTAPLGEIQVFDAAALLAGHREVGAYAKAWRDSGYHTLVPFTLFPVLLLEEEQECFRQLHGAESEHAPSGRPKAVSSLPPPLKVETSWISIEIVSEPFIVMTGRGYAPLLLVQELSTGERHGLYAGARSLASELEKVRDLVGRLTGTRVRLRRTGQERTARYEVGIL